MPMFLLAFFSKYWQYLVVAGVVLAVLGGTYAKGRADGGAHEKRAEAARLIAAQKRVVKREAKADAITDRTADKLAKTRVQIEYRTKTLIEKVPTYVPQAADAECRVPVGFVLLHDAAASGGSAELPKAAGGSIDAPSGVALSSVAATVTENYGEALTWRAEAQAWRDWYTAQAKAWDKP
jgi:hypothetical protein